MSIQRFNPITFPRKPLNNITPFSYRDGYTFLELVENLRIYVETELVGELNETITLLLQNFADAIIDLQNSNQNQQDTLQELYDTFIADMSATFADLVDSNATFKTDIAALVEFINNKTGNVGIQYIDLVPNTPIALNVLWPTEHPVMYVARQNATGTGTITFSSVIDGSVHVDATPNSETYFTLIPKGNGRWLVDTSPVFDVARYGAVGDGVTNDTPAILRALRHANQTGGVLLFPPGRYNVPSGSESVFPVTSSQFTKHVFELRDNVTVQGHGATIVENINLATRRLCFFINGSNVSVEGLSFYNSAAVTAGERPANIAIGAGDEFGGTLVTKTLSGIRIKDCTFDRAWHPIKIQQKGTTGHNVDNVIVTGCVHTAPSGVTSSGGISFVASPEGRITNLTVSNNAVNDVENSSAIGVVGVYHSSITGNVCRNSGPYAAGIQLENGSRHATISGNTLHNHYNGIWVDDGSHVAIVGNNVDNDMPRSSNRGIRVTWQGYRTDDAPLCDGINISGNVVRNSYISCSTFSDPVLTPNINEISIVGNTVTTYDSVVPYNIYVTYAKMLNISNNVCTGAATTNIYIAARSGMQIVVTGNMTGNIGASDAIGFTMPEGSGGTPTSPVVFANRFLNSYGQIPVPTKTGFGAIELWEGNLTGGNPTRQAPIGSMWFTRAGGMWLKTGALNTSWTLQ